MPAGGAVAVVQVVVEMVGGVVATAAERLEAMMAMEEKEKVVVAREVAIQGVVDMAAEEMEMEGKGKVARAVGERARAVDTAAEEMGMEEKEEVARAAAAKRAADTAAEEMEMEGKGEAARAVGARARAGTAAEEKAVEEKETVVVAMAMVGVKAVAVTVAIAEAGPAAATVVGGAASALERRSPDSRIQTRTQQIRLQHRRRRKGRRYRTGNRFRIHKRSVAVP